MEHEFDLDGDIIPERDVFSLHWSELRQSEREYRTKIEGRKRLEAEREADYKQRKSEMELKAIKTPPVEWGPPEPAEDEKIPLDALVAPMHRIIKSAAELVQCPLEMSAQVAMGVATAVVARSVTVEVGSRREPTNLWTLIVAPSSERKSSIMGVLQKPMESIESELRSAAAPKRRAW